MARGNKHSTDSEAFRRYHSGEMSSVERHAFEKAMLDDLFAQEALEGMESITPDHLQADLKLLETQLRQRTHRGQGLVIWRVAAALVMLGVFSFMVYYFIETRATVELAQEKPISTELSDTLSLQQKPTDIILPAEPDRIIAYQQDFKEESALSPANSSVDAEQQKQIQEVAQSEKEEDVIIEDQIFDAPVQLDEIAVIVEKPAVETRSLAAAVSEVDASKAAVKKDAPSGAKRQKARVSEQPSAVDAATLVATERKIRGKVTSVEDDSPTPGVNVVIKGTSTGAITDIDGNYELSVPEGQDATLVFSSVGYNTEEIEVANARVVDIAMAADVTALSEIVVTGCGTTSPSDLAPYSYTPPRPVGGQAKFKEYVKSNLRYPDSGLAAGTAGSVKVEFIVETNGLMTNLLIIRGIGEDFDNEAMRLVKDGPDWEPAEVNGAKASRKVKITIRFKPPE